jgi:hypothetical protein
MANLSTGPVVWQTFRIKNTLWQGSALFARRVSGRPDLVKRPYVVTRPMFRGSALRLFFGETRRQNGMNVGFARVGQGSALTVAR